MLHWQEDAPVEEILGIDDLDKWLDRIIASCDPETPIMVKLDAHEHCAAIGLGAKLSFVTLTPNSGLPPYFMTLGDPHNETSIDFFLFGQHHTEIAGKNLIPNELARQVLREFLQPGIRSSQVAWEEVFVPGCFTRLPWR